MKRYSSLLFVLPILLILAACSNTPEQPTEDTATEMLQHTVYFYLNSDVTSEEKEAFEEGLEELLEIPAIHQSELGVPAATEERDVTDHGYAYVIYAWFETMEDYKTYADHPDHLEFIDEFNGLWADVKVYDADIISD